MLRACAARVTVLCLCVCLSVCLSVVRLSVDTYSCTTAYKAAYELYKWVQTGSDLNNKKGILLKRLRSGDMA